MHSLKMKATSRYLWQGSLEVDTKNFLLSTARSLFQQVWSPLVLLNLIIFFIKKWSPLVLMCTLLQIHGEMKIYSVYFLLLVLSDDICTQKVFRS